jgi:CheY-like chemotaxis protein
MTHGTVKAHGGTMSISSQPGLGTTVKLRFPRIPAPAQSETVKPPSLSVPLDSMKVLLVDDEESVRSLVTLMLKEAGVHQVKAFSGGKKALESLRAGELPDIVILDQNMPGMDGIQAMIEIRKLHPDLPILIASGQPGIEQWECFRQPRLGVITKPFSVEEIQAKLGHFACQPNTGQ